MKKALKLNVAGGMGLVMISTRPDNANVLPDVMGARFKGCSAAGDSSEIVLTDSPLGSADTLEKSGRGVVLKNLGGLTVGSYQPEDKSALIINTYRLGKTALVGFDPADLTNVGQAETLLGNLFNFAAPQVVSLFPGSVVDLQWSVSHVDPPLNVSLTQTSDVQIELLNVIDGEVVDMQTGLWQRSIDTEQDDFNAVIRLPFEKGEFAISAELSENQDGVLTSLQGAELLVSTDRDYHDVEASLLELMRSTEVLRKHDKYKLKVAIWKVKKAIDTPLDNRYRVYLALSYLAHAYEIVGVIRQDLSEIQSQIGLLYRLYQLEQHQLVTDEHDWNGSSQWWYENYNG